MIFKFHKDFYNTKGINCSISAWQDFAIFKVSQDDTHILLDAKMLDAQGAADFENEFCNYALFSSIKEKK